MAPLNQNSQLVQSNPYLYYPNQQYMIQPQMQQQYTPQASQQQPTNQQQNTQTVMSDRIWVQGENAAKAYLVAKNSEQVLWDSEQPAIYIKTVDIYGRPTTVTLDYTIRPVEIQNNGVANSEVTDLKNEVGGLKDGLNDLKSMFEDFMKNQTQTKTYKSNYNNQKGGNN